MILSSCPGLRSPSVFSFHAAIPSFFLKEALFPFFFDLVQERDGSYLSPRFFLPAWVSGAP